MRARENAESSLFELRSSPVMASEQWPAWFRLTVVSGAKVIVKKYVGGLNSSDCIGDLITPHLSRDNSQAPLDRADIDHNHRRT